MSFLSGFRKRKAIKYGSTLPTAALASFSKLFVITGDTDIGTELSTQKLAVTLADGITLAPYGALSFSSSGGSATLRIRAKFTLSNSAVAGDVLGYLYYDSSGSDQSDKTNVFDSFTKAYLPLEEDPSGADPAIKDWTSGANNASMSGAMTSANLVTGKVASGLTFDGSNDALAISTTRPDFSTGFTISLIIKGTGADHVVAAETTPISLDTDRAAIDWTHPSAGYAGSFFMQGNGSFPVAKWTTTIGAGNFGQIDCTWDGTTMRVYINGQQEATAANSTYGTPLGSWLQIAGMGATRNFAGLLDEIKVAATPRAAAWIAYDYQNQFNNSATFTLGAEETGESTAGRLPVDFVQLRGILNAQVPLRGIKNANVPQMGIANSNVPLRGKP
jgi:hypothetical protein